MWRGRLVAVCAAVAATAACSADRPATAPTLAETAPATTSTSAPPPVPATPTTPAVVTTDRATTTTSSTTSTTGAPAPTTTEPARSRPADRLPRPRGFARHEPGPVHEGYAALTGLPAGPDVRARPALAVKIDNAPGGRPPWNLDDADLVFEENVEGVTRFVAVYHTNQPDRIGPVRSARTSDLDILAGLNRPILAWSGGNGGVTAAVRGAHEYGWLSNLSALTTTCYWRSASRSAPHNLLLDPACAWASTTYAGPARPVFDHAPGGPWPSDGDGRFRVRMDGVAIAWEWVPDCACYARRQAGDWHVDADGSPVVATNVVEMFVRYVPSAVDERSPEAETVGSGQVVVHRDGVAVSGTWSRPDRFASFTLVADDGTALTLAPGTTFVELERAT